jgi:hypothetical protein
MHVVAFAFFVGGPVVAIVAVLGGEREETMPAGTTTRCRPNAPCWRLSGF